MRHLRLAPGAYVSGRHIDPAAGLPAGEGAQQLIPSVKADEPPPPPLEGVPDRRFARLSVPDYYGLPALKEAPWIWAIPAYFHLGGITGAAAVLASTLQLADRPEQAALLARCRWLGLAGTLAGSALLTYDLGRPARFYNMLRVIRPTSPMSLGSWGLALTGGKLAATLLLAGRSGTAGALGRATGVGGGLMGTFLAGYTGVLLANTSLPIYQETRRVLPVLFTASGAAGLGAVLEAMRLSPVERRIVRSFTLAGMAAEVVTSELLQQRASVIPEVGRALKQGRPGLLWKAGKFLSGMGLGLFLTTRDRIRTGRLAASAVITAGAMAMRYGLFKAGAASARDPQALFRQQHAVRAVPADRIISRAEELPSASRRDQTRMKRIR